jgi:hypothetical protein
MVWMALDKQLREVAQRKRSPRRCKLFRLDKASQNLRYFDINEMWSVNPLGWMQRSGSYPLRPSRLQHQLNGR